MRAYDHAKIEKKWQEAWKKAKLYQVPDAKDGKENFYLLVEFPYPSGNLHVGHWYAFAVPDILARHLRMKGHNVLYPIGFDAFGLPAENAAIKNGVNPRLWTESNMSHMRKQIASMGTSFDTSREVVTCHPDYYRWTQWLFLQLYKANLAYRKETAVNWCPKDKTVLANEQVVAGKCERCSSEVIQKQMLQWNLKITDYADRLVDDLAPLEWPEEIKDSQRHWIGRSEGAEIDFYLDFGDEAVNARTDSSGKRAHITVFTTRPDTLFGATYLVLAPEHPWVTLALQHKTVLKNNAEVQSYIDQSKRKTELERQTDKTKTGVRLEGVEAINPASGEKIPLYVADYVLGHYGTGAIMAVPAHDERDFEFAKAMSAPVKQVIARVVRSTVAGDAVREGEPFTPREAVMCIVKHWEKNEYLAIRWKDFDVRSMISGGIEAGETPIEAGAREIREESGYLNPRFVRQVGGVSFIEFYHQLKKRNVRAKFRYLYFELENGEQEEVSAEESAKHTLQWVKSEDMLEFLNLNEKEAVWSAFMANKEEPYAGDGYLVNSEAYDGLPNEEAKQKMSAEFGRKKTTYKLRDWIVSRQRYWGVPIPIIHCVKCGAVPVPEKELPVLLPDIEDYLPTGDGKSPLAKVEPFVHTACPTCGGQADRETDTFDTFVDSSWYFVRYSDPHNEREFAAKEKQASWLPVDLYSGGAEHTTMHLLYSRFWHKALFDLGLVADAEPYTRRLNRSIILGPDHQKMSKSRGNVIDPDEVVKNLGADTVRMYLAFIGPYGEVGNYPWNPDGVVGVRRFLERVWRAQEYVLAEPVPALQPALHKTIKKVGDDIRALKFNTAVAQLMMLLNEIEKHKKIASGDWDVFIKLLAPFAPHAAEELWSESGHHSSVHEESWPEHDESKLHDEHYTMAVQINGKTRAEIAVSDDLTKLQIEEAAKEAIATRILGKKIARSVVVPRRLVNFVLEE
jgi:leucyl-tRNA synthetase